MADAMDGDMEILPTATVETKPVLSDLAAVPSVLNGMANEATAIDDGVSMVHSTAVSREPSMPAKGMTHLTIVSASDDEDELGDADEDEANRIPVAIAGLPTASLPSGLCYDPRMRFHAELDPPKDRSDFHPEDPRRIFWIYRAICEAGLAEDRLLGFNTTVAQPLKRIDVRHATKAEVLLVHTQEHFDFVKETTTKTDEWLTHIEKKFDSIYFSQSTYNAALLSTGAAIDTCLAVARGNEIKNAMAVIRPPGHHAECDRSMGFCHFDNVAVSAKVLQQHIPDVRKVLILDWDVHHGNGIQQAFEDDPNVLYISIHVHEDGRFYPAGDYGDHLHCGIGAGIGKNINIPWPTKGMGDADYLFAFQQIVMPVAFDFDPDFVIIAAGFDAAVGDQLGGCFVTPECYAHMTHMLMSLAGGKVVACLEGGYNLESIAASALSVTRTLMGEPPPRIEAHAATKGAIETVHKVMLHQSRYWRCLYPRDPQHEFEGIDGTEHMHDIVRNYQSSILAESHHMFPLWIFRETMSRSFEKQVMATKDYTDDNPLLLIFRDPPEVLGRVDTITGKVALHELRMCDIMKRYIGWAISQKIAVIDCNIPKFLTGISDRDGLPEEEALKVAKATEELAIYIWENYVEVSDSKRVILLGVGDAYRAVTQILNTRTWENVTQFAGAVGVIASDGTIRSINESFMTDFGRTYFKRSMIYVGETHPIWDPERKRPNRKFGHLHQAGTDGLTRMLAEHQDEIKEFILSRAGLADGTGNLASEGGERVSARLRSGAAGLLGSSAAGLLGIGSSNGNGVSIVTENGTYTGLSSNGNGNGNGNGTGNENGVPDLLRASERAVLEA